MLHRGMLSNNHSVLGLENCNFHSQLPSLSTHIVLFRCQKIIIKSHIKKKFLESYMEPFLKEDKTLFFFNFANNT